MSSDNRNKLIPAGRPQAEPLIPAPRVPDRGGYGYGYGYGYGGVQDNAGEFNLRDYINLGYGHLVTLPNFLRRYAKRLR